MGNFSVTWELLKQKQTSLVWLHEKSVILLFFFVAERPISPHNCIKHIYKTYPVMSDNIGLW